MCTRSALQCALKGVADTLMGVMTITNDNIYTVENMVLFVIHGQILLFHLQV